GPTEAAIDVTYWPCRDDCSGEVPIGSPIWNTRIYVLDGCLEPVPVGVVGELYIAGGWSWARLCWARRAGGGGVCCRPVWCCGEPDVPQRGLGALARRWGFGVCGACGPSG